MSKKKIEKPKKEIPFLPVLDDITTTMKIKNNLDHNSIGELSIVDTKALVNILSKWIDYFELQIDEDGNAGRITLIEEGEFPHERDYAIRRGAEIEGICKFLRFFTNKIFRCPRCKKMLDVYRDDISCPFCYFTFEEKNKC
ncbi:unnamed protein product [marine sediment metagenome]|uniref:Uncharacterized protein n=1 Tax=marine sediment metagenome TaxID=412755 RepID=X0YQ51_9ZZZZ